MAPSCPVRSRRPATASTVWSAVKRLAPLLSVALVLATLFAGCAPVRGWLLPRPGIPKDWRGVLAEVRASIQPALKTSVIDVAASDAEFSGDLDLLQRAFENLLRNAGEAGATKISVAAHKGAEHPYVSVADNGKAAFDLLKERKRNFFDVILLDINMPIMNGFQTIELFHDYLQVSGIEKMLKLRSNLNVS